MKLIISACFLFLGAQASAGAKNLELPWRPVSYEKIILPTRTAEGVAFIRHERANSADVYTLEYFIGSKVLISRMLPKDMYTQLLTKLRRTVFVPATKDLGQVCANRIVWAEGLTQKSKVKSIGYCLSESSPDGQNSSANFSAWYDEVRRMLGV